MTAAIAISLALGGCATNKVIDVSMAVWCETNHPERPTPEQYATYTEQKKTDMADHNDFGRLHCGWTP